MSEFPYQILLMSCFLIADSILRVEILIVIVRGKFSPGLNCLRSKSLETSDFCVKEWPDFLELLKKDEK